MRYCGIELVFMIIKLSDDSWDFGRVFVEYYCYEFGFMLDERDIIIDDVCVCGIGKSFQYGEKIVDEQFKIVQCIDVFLEKKYFEVKVYFEGGWLDIFIYKFIDFFVGNVIKGLVMLVDGI